MVGPRILRRFCSVTLTALVLCASSGAFAQDSVPATPQAAATPDPDAAARAHFARGRAAYEHGDFAVALDAFQAAYAASQHPKLLYNLGLAEQRLGNASGAVEAFESYLAWGQGDREEEVRGRLAALRDLAKQQPPPSAPGPAETAAAAPPEPSPPPAAPVDSAPPSRSRRVWWIAGGVALAAALVVGVAVPLSQRDRTTLEEPETNTGLTIRALRWGAP